MDHESTVFIPQVVGFTGKRWSLYFEALKATRIIGLDMQSKYKVSVGDMWDTFHLLHSGRQYGARFLISPFSNSMHHWRNRVSFCYVI